MFNILKKIALLILNLTLHLAAIAALGYIFWPFIDLGIRASGLPGFDSAQFIYYVNLFSKSLPLPQAGWDQLWYEGAPRVLDYVFLPHYLIQPLVAKYGLVMATKLFPLIMLSLFYLSCYFLFQRLSKNHLFAALLTLGVMFSQSIYMPIYTNGVVVSGLSNDVFPSILLFLVLYAQKKSFRYLALASMAQAFQIYMHPAMALAFGFASSMIFLTLFRFQEEKFLSLQPFKRICSFVFMTFSIAALTTFPQLMEASSGAGNYGKSPFGSASGIPKVFDKLIEVTHPSLYLAFGLAILVGIIFFKKQNKKLLFPIFMMLLYFLSFEALVFIGKNPVGDFLFPPRVFWFFAVILGALSALLFAPLTVNYKSKLKFLLPLGWIIISGGLIIVLMKYPFDLYNYKLIAQPTIPAKEVADKKVFSNLRKDLQPILKEVDESDTNYRIWDHGPAKSLWNMISDIPAVEGYFHFMTKYSAEWTAWFNATLAEEVVKNKTIPQDMADKQGQFLIDWYGVKYLYANPGEEFNLAPRFYEENDYVLKKSSKKPPSVFTIKPEYTSGIIEAVNVPLVGFIGSYDGYNIFMRNMGMLNLNTHYIVPLRLGTSIDSVSKEDLSRLKLLVIYGIKDKGGDWDKIERFIKEGGSLFIETGGENAFRQGKGLPSVFPMKNLSFGSLGEQWDVETSGNLSGVDFKRLEPLIYQKEPWKLSYLDDGSLRNGASVLLTQAGKPVIIEQKIGSGKIIWSGINSLYRPWELKKNGMEEVKIVDGIFKELLETPYTSPVEISIKREKPEKIEVRGEGFSGVLLKEKNLPGWNGYVEVNGYRKGLKRYAAGIDFMYFAIPKDLKGSLKVNITYDGRLSYWAFFFISIFSFIFVSEEAISNGFILRKIAGKFKAAKIGEIIKSHKIAKKMGSWWEKDEDE